MPVWTRSKISCLGAAGALLACSPASAHVNLRSPNGGETLTPGAVVTIQWEVGVRHDTLDWDLWYSTTGPDGPWIPIATDLPAGDINGGAQHSFDWTVPNTPSGQVRVRVRQDNSGRDYFDESDDDLAIAPPCAAEWNGDGILNSDDFFAFFTDFLTGDADFDGSGLTNSDDFFVYLATFMAGC